MPRIEIIARPDRDLLGEGPFWHGPSGALYWVDIVAPALNRLALSSGGIDRWPMPEPIGWVVERTVGGLLAGFRSGIAALDPETGAIEHWCAPEADRPHNRLNDAKVDPAGRLWFGSKDDRDREETGALYRMTADRAVARFDDGYRVANGPAFSPDGAWLYHTDSGRRTVYRFALRADGTLGTREDFLRFEDGWGYPDGMTTDAEGCLWIAHWGGGAISRFDPHGARMASIALPALNITSCAFGGGGLDRLFVTSAAMDSPGRAEDGALFMLDPGVTGLPASRFPG